MAGSHEVRGSIPLYSTINPTASFRTPFCFLDYNGIGLETKGEGAPDVRKNDYAC